ncbi:MAG: hypothetical protein C4532_08585 [Candidatus Abyssobacteria bacterium SURF_17]|uniref:Cytochrome c domain-containing protein n=1 Tax=Candidatus Abyssobacteria bacterium SURF_17 TaxID=2093361 RepID=A0A419EZA4_9BACT|nr:MAG: hypothetical protein C4532_08585 [Candidatus Abyssubacteria bacterium SURF_17]
MNKSSGLSFRLQFLSPACALILLFVLCSAVAAQSFSSGGDQLFKEKCAICHPLDRALNRFDPTESWEKVVARQRSKAPFWISSDEAKAITAYLEHREKAVSAGRPDLLPEAMATRQNLIVVEPAARMHESVAESRFDTANGALAANELFLSGVPFFEKMTQLGIPTDNELVSITSEESYWYSRYILSAIAMESGIGIHLLQSRRIILQAEEEAISPREFYENFLTRVRERTGQNMDVPGTFPIFAEFASGEPELTELPDLNDYNTLRWNPQKFDKTITPAALGQTLYSQALWAEYFFGSKHGENLLGNDALEGYLGAILVAEAVSKMHFLRTEAAYDGKELGAVNPFAYEAKLLYFPHQLLVELSYPEGAPPAPVSYQVVDPSSHLFDQASLLLGASEFYRFSDPKVEDNWDAVFGSPAEGALFPPEPHNVAKGLTGIVLKNMIAMHFDPIRQTFVSNWANGERGKTISAVDAGLTLVALANAYSAFHDDEEIRQGARKMLERQAQFLAEYLQLADGGFVEHYNLETSAHAKVPRTLASQAMAIRGLIAAYQVTENSSYIESALSVLNFMNQNLWSSAARMYRSAEGTELSRYSPLDIGATLGALREAILLKQDGDAIKKFKLVFTTALKNNGMQLAELEPTGEKMGSVADVMTPDSDGDGVRKPQFAGGKFGVAPVVAGQVEFATP